MEDSTAQGVRQTDRHAGMVRSELRVNRTSSINLGHIGVLLVYIDANTQRFRYECKHKGIDANKHKQ